MKTKCLSIVLLLLVVSPLSLANVVVIVHPDNNAELNDKQIKRLFLGKEKKFSTGKESIPINQPPDSVVRQAFDTDILGRNTTQVSAYWSKQVFTGKGIPPKEVDDDAAVIAIVSSNPDAIGYVDASAATDAVKVLTL